MTVRYEIRARRSGMSVSFGPETLDEASALFATDAMTREPDERLELVRIEENILQHRGEGPPIDPWEAIKLLHQGTPK